MVSVASTVALRVRIRPTIVAVMRDIVLGGLFFETAIYAVDVLIASPGFDFASYFGAALALRFGQNPYSLAAMQSVAATHGHVVLVEANYLYPPLLGLVLIPATYLPFAVIMRAWIVLTIALWFTMAWMLRDVITRVLGAHANWTVFVFVLALTYAPMTTGISLGQLSPIIAFLFVWILWLDVHGKGRWAGGVLALASWLKVFPLILFGYYLLRRRWDVIVPGSIAFLALGFFQLIFAGPATLGRSTAILFGFASNPVGWQNEAFRLVPGRIASVFGWSSPAFATLGLAMAATVLIATGLYIWRKRDTSIETHILGLLWTLCALVLVLPVAWDHYYAWLLPACIFGIALCLSRNVPWTPLVLLGFGYFATLYDTPTSPSLALSVFYTCLRPVGALLLWAGIGWLYLRPVQVKQNRHLRSIVYMAGCFVARAMIWAPLFFLPKP